jgi:hypothetical protein
MAALLCFFWSVIILIAAIVSCWILSFLAFDVFVLACRCIAFPVESKVVVSQIEAQFLGNRSLPFFDDFIIEFLYSPAVYADNMVMMKAALQLEYGLPAFEMMPGDKSRSFELGKRAIHSSQPDLLACFKQQPKDGLGCKVPILGFFEKLQHLEAGCGDFKAGIAQILAFHAGNSNVGCSEMAVIPDRIYFCAFVTYSQSIPAILLATEMTMRVAIQSYSVFL